MPLEIQRVQAWCADIPDRAGAAAGKLELLARAGADLECVFTRPHPTRPDRGMMFLAPISGPEQIQAARDAGLGPATDVAVLCVRGVKRQGVGYDLMSHLAVAGINLRALSVSQGGGRFTAYLALDSADAAALAVQVLATLDA